METIVGPPKHAGRARPPSAPQRTVHKTDSTKSERLKMIVRGAVQGVGFRPFVYRLAAELRLNGYVSNTAQGVLIEVEGARNLLKQFQWRIQTEKPP
ncbi:MAG TPA: acylphosphatase, partial [Candidatus Udaeobacter sp.]